MKVICVLLNGPVKNDHRVIKVINSLSKEHIINLFYLDGSDADENIFNSNVSLFSFICKDSLLNKIKRHSFFWTEHNFLYKKALLHGGKIDFVWCNDLPTLYPGAKIAKQTGAKLIYDTHEIYLETLNQFFPSKSKGIKSLFYKLSLMIMRTFGKFQEQKLIKKAQNVITVNKSLAAYFEHKYRLRNIDVIMNFPITSSLNPKNFIDFRNLYSFNINSKILIYQGVLNKGRGINLLIEAMKKTIEDIKLIILGNGILKLEAQALVKKLNLEHRIKFIDKVPLVELLNYTSGADFGINLLEDINLSKKLASPNKLYEYIHAGIPVICSNTIENMKVLDKFKIGINVENNIDDVSSKINTFVLKDMSSYKLECKRAAQEYNWECQEKSILNLIG